MDNSARSDGKCEGAWRRRNREEGLRAARSESASARDCGSAGSALAAWQTPPGFLSRCGFGVVLCQQFLRAVDKLHLTTTIPAYHELLITTLF